MATENYYFLSFVALVRTQEGNLKNECQMALAKMYLGTMPVQNSRKNAFEVVTYKLDLV